MHHGAFTRVSPIGINPLFLLFFTVPEAKIEKDHVKVIPLPLNPAQVPNPLQPRHPKDLVPPEAVHHRQSESPPPALGVLGSTWAEFTKAGRFQLSFVAPPLPTVTSSMKAFNPLPSFLPPSLTRPPRHSPSPATSVL